MRTFDKLRRLKDGDAVQTALAVNSPGDRYEREAEAMANSVVGSGVKPSMRLQQEKPKASSAPPDVAFLSAGISARPSASTDVSDVVDPVVGASGQELDGSTRGFMESRFGHDFSSVRVHADDGAAASARAIGARAYTLGNDVVFGEGRYAPHTIEGRHLLAHELTHVVQQQGGGSAPAVVQRAGEVVPAPNWSPNAKLTFDPNASVVLDDGRAFGTWFPANPNGKIERIRVPRSSAGTMTINSKVWWLWDHPTFTNRWGCISMSTDVRFKIDAYGKVEFGAAKPGTNVSNDAVGQITAKADATATPGAQFGGNLMLTAAIEAAAQLNQTSGTNNSTQNTTTKTDENNVGTSATPLGVGIQAGGKVANSSATTTSGGTSSSYAVTLAGTGGWNRSYVVELDVEGIGGLRGEMVSVFFKDEGLTTLSDEGVGQLLAFAKNLPQQAREELMNGTNKLLVTSYASSSGSETANVKVTQGRSASVKSAVVGILDWLKAKPDSVAVENKGKVDADPTTKEPQANDRRVDIAVWWTEGVAPAGAAAKP